METTQTPTPAEQAALELFKALIARPGGPQPLDGPKMMLRADFDGLTPAQQLTFVKAGGSIVDPAPAPKQREPLGENQMYREDFDNLTPDRAMAFVKGGGSIVNG